MVEPYKPNLTFLIFDSLSIPLIIFNVAGDISYANPAAVKIESEAVVKLKKSAQVQEIIKNVLMGKLDLPAKMDLTIDISKSKIISGTFVRGPTGVDVVFLPEESKNIGINQELSTENFQVDSTIKLIQQDLLPSVNHLSDQIVSFEEKSSRVEVTDFSGIQSAIQELRNRLNSLVDLTRVFGDELKVFNDLMIMPQIVDSVCIALKPLADKFQIQLTIDGVTRELPQIYGNLRLIYRAIYEVLHHTMLKSREGVLYKEWMQIKISLMTTGSFLNISIHNMGAVSRPNISRDTVGQNQSLSLISEKVQQTTRIGIPMARRIIELHGGTMKISADDLRGSFVLFELPTGAPVKPAAELSMLQAKAYAADMSKLFERMRKLKK
jgi:hypothetical protein